MVVLPVVSIVVSFLDVTITDPEVPVAVPDSNVIPPAVPEVAAPAVTVIDPPVALVVAPAVTVIDPPFPPDVDAPPVIATAPPANGVVVDVWAPPSIVTAGTAAVALVAVPTLKAPTLVCV